MKIEKMNNFYRIYNLNIKKEKINIYLVILCVPSLDLRDQQQLQLFKIKII